MNVKEYRELYEGLTQNEDAFREKIKELGSDFDNDIMFSELQRSQNRLNYAMLGIHPIYRREVELSGMVDFNKETFALFHMDGEKVYPFQELDPSYVAFLDNQKRIYNAKDTLPLSSVALKTSNELLKEDMTVPDLTDTCMNLPQETLSSSRKVLDQAFKRSMVLMNHLHNQIEKHGLDKTYGANRKQLMQYVNSNSFDFSFKDSVNELNDVAQEATNDHSLLEGL